LAKSKKNRYLLPALLCLSSNFSVIADLGSGLLATHFSLIVYVIVGRRIKKNRFSYAQMMEAPMPTIRFNGKTYNDLAEMPATERKAYDQMAAMFADKNQNGVPDIFEGDVVQNIMSFATNTTVTVNGEQKSLDSMPPETREKLEKALEKLNELGVFSHIRVPDEAKDAAPQWTEELRSSPPIIQSPSAIQEDTPNRSILILVVMGVLIIAGIGLFVLMSVR